MSLPKIAPFLLVLAWLWPGHYYPWFSAEQDAIAIVALLLLAVAMLARAARVHVPRASVFVFAVAVVPWLQWAGGLLAFRSDALLSSTYLGLLGLAILTARNLGPELPRALLLALSAGALLQLPLGIAQWLGFDAGGLIEWVGLGGRVGGNLKQPNQLATLLALGLVAIGWLFEARRITRTLALVLAGLLLAGMAMTQSRTPWLIAAAWLILWVVLKRRIQLRTSAGALIGLAVVYVISTGIWLALNASLWGGSARPLSDQLRGGPRTAVWEIAVDAILHSPWFGYGWQPFHVAEIAVAASHSPTHYRFESSHNLVLDLLIWNGAPLGLLLVFGVGAWVAIRVGRCATSNAAAALAGLIALLAHSMVELPLEYANFLVPAGLLVGIVEYEAASTHGTASLTIPRLPLAAVFAASSVVMAVMFAEYTDWQASHQRYEFERALKKPTPGYEPWVPKGVLLDGPRELMRLLLLPPQTQVGDAELEDLRTVAERHGTGEALLRYATLAQASGRPDEAERAVSTACRFVPSKECEGIRRTVRRDEPAASLDTRR
jgi:O-antigen ligase